MGRFPLIIFFSTIILGKTFAKADPIAVNAQSFRPAFIGETLNEASNLLTLDGTQTGGKRFSFGVQLWTDFGYRPLAVLVSDRGNQGDILTHMVTMHLGTWLNVSDHLAFGILLPAVVMQDKDPTQFFTYPNVMAGNLGLSDLRLAAKWTLIDNRLGGFGLAIVPQVSFPTGDGNQYRGEDAFLFEPRIALDYRFKSIGILIAANLGFTFRTSPQTVSSISIETSPHTQISHQIRYALGASIPLAMGFSMMAEFSGATGLVNAPNNIQSPLEFYLAGKWTHPTGISLLLGGGRGVTRAVAVADARVFAMVGYTFQNTIK